jgi:hypothetical protein
MLESIRQRVGLSPTKINVALPRSEGSSSSSSSSLTTTTTLSKSNQAEVKTAANTSDNPVYGYLVLESSKGIEKGRFPLRKRVTTVGR